VVSIRGTSYVAAAAAIDSVSVVFFFKWGVD